MHPCRLGHLLVFAKEGILLLRDLREKRVLRGGEGSYEERRDREKPSGSLQKID